MVNEGEVLDVDSADFEGLKESRTLSRRCRVKGMSCRKRGGPTTREITVEGGTRDQEL